MEKYLGYIQYNSVVILTLFFICLGVMILDTITKGKTTNAFFSTTTNDNLLNPFTYVKWFTYALGHLNWEHFIHNFLYILLIGPLVEEKYGSMNLVYMMLITAGVGGLFNRLFCKNKRALGASGLGFMLIVLSSFVNIQTGKIPLTVVLIIIFYLVKEVIHGLTKKDNISHGGHLLGGLCGLIFGIYFTYFV